MITTKTDYCVQVPKYIRKNELKRFSWQSLIFYSLLRTQSQNEKTNGKYINFSSSILQKRFGKEYRKHIEFLLKEDWVQENPRYKNGEGGFSKSFRISDKNFAWVHKSHAIKLQKRIWEKFAGAVAIDKSDPTSFYLSLIIERHNMLYITSARSIESKKLKVKLDRKLANVRFAANDRVLSTIIESKSDYRQDVMFGSYGRLANIDVSGMIQQQLNRYIKDKKWNKWVQQDFLFTLIDYLGLRCSRDMAKKSFMRAISNKCDTGNAERIRGVIEFEFPLIMEYINELNQKGTVQGVTQREEAQMIREFILQHDRLEVIPAHDGLFCGEKNALDVQDYFENFLKQQGLAGFTKIKPDNLNLKRRTTLDVLESLGLLD